MFEKMAQEFAKADALEESAKKRQRQVKATTESLDAAEKRILDMKLKDDEALTVRKVFQFLRDGKLTRTKAGKWSKSEVFELAGRWVEMERQRKRQWVLDNRPANLRIITNHLELAALWQALDSEPIVALDTETTGLDLYNDRIIGVCVYFPNADIQAYVPFGHIDPADKEAFEEHGRRYGFSSAIDTYRLANQLPKADVLRFWQKCVTGRQTVWHHYKYDGHMSINDGITPDPAWWDTQTAQRILFDHELNYRLKHLHELYVAKTGEAVMFEDLFPDYTIFDKPMDLAGIYAAGDAYKTFKLYEWQKPWIDTRGRLRIVWYEIEQKLLHIDLMTERQGFRIDLAWLEELEKEYAPKFEEAERVLLEAFGIDEAFLSGMALKLGADHIEKFNVNSSDHLAYLIYDVVGADERMGLKFKKALRSTAKEVVDALCEDEPRLEPLLEYRTMGKLLNTYIRAIPLSMEPADGRLHVSFKNGADEQGAKAGADTGRYSSSEYTSGKNSRTGDHKKGMNIQNIPARNELGVKVRMAWIPDEGHLFVGTDLSQIEPRVIAHILYEMFGDSAMRDMYLAGVDLYTTMAMRTFNLAEEFCVDGAYDPTHSFKPRKLMKQGVLAYLYGQTPFMFAKTMGVSEEVATVFFEGMTKAFTGLKPMRDWIINSLLHGTGTVAYSETLDGRRRRYPEYREAKPELEALEAKCWRDGCDIYSKGGPRPKTKGRTEEQQAQERMEIEERVGRFQAGELTEDDRQVIFNCGLYLRNYGQKDRLWELRRLVGKAERAAVNMVIQGTAADILKRNIIALFTLCQERGWKFLASIHDEVWLSLPKEDVTPDNVKLIDACMTETVSLTVPLKCDTVIQPRWMDEYKAWKAWDFEKGAPKEWVA